MARKWGEFVILRPAVAADALEIADVFLAARRDALSFVAVLHSDDETRRWISDVVMRRSVMWVAVLDRKIVGFFSLLSDQLDQLYVQPGYYRQGIGDRLLAKAKQLSPRRLWLHTSQRNERARAFYEARDFVPVDFGDGSRNEEREPDVLYQWVAPSGSDRTAR
jgi:GNAT superfamily N-acetyltransferase